MSEVELDVVRDREFMLLLEAMYRGAFRQKHQEDVGSPWVTSFPAGHEAVGCRAGQVGWERLDDLEERLDEASSHRSRRGDGQLPTRKLRRMVAFVKKPQETKEKAGF